MNTAISVLIFIMLVGIFTQLIVVLDCLLNIKWDLKKLLEQSVGIVYPNEEGD